MCASLPPSLSLDSVAGFVILFLCLSVFVLSLTLSLSVLLSLCLSVPLSLCLCLSSDGMGGGNDVHHNLIGNFVRESADHGNENSWDRVPFITTFADGKTKSLAPAWTRNHHNFWILPNFGSNIDHDDGSAYYNDSFNVEVQGGGWTKHSGPHQMALGNIWIAPVGESVYPWLGCASGITGQSGNFIGPFSNNTCT